MITKIKVFVCASLFFVSLIAQGSEKSILVKFKPPTFGISIVANAFEVAQAEGLIIREHKEQIDMFVMEPLDPKFSLEKFSKKSNVLYAEPNVKVYAIGGPQISTTLTPNDPKLSGQFEMRRIGVETAWETTTGSYDVVVAVSDTGVSLNHPDLKNQIWTNPGEIPGNGVDDDGNGFVDDTQGWDFKNNDNEPDDDQSHGTHVAGIIAAEGNNGVGISGVNWKTRIMPVKFLGADGSGDLDGGIGTILYAADNGAKILNASWGGGGHYQALLDALNYAASKGMLVIAASGNDGKDVDQGTHLPSSYETENMVAVSASARNAGALASFSNYGEFGSDVAAPGLNILSCVLNGEYNQYSGTSMATPMVAGVAALILSQNPNLSMLQLRNALFNATDEFDSYEKKTATRGEINAATAVAQLAGPFQVWPATMTIKKGGEFQFSSYNANGTVTWSSSDVNIASVSESGLVTGLAKGVAMISATDSAGTLAANRWLRVSEPSADGGGGCKENGKPGRKFSTKETVNAAINFSLPFLFALAFRRRAKQARC